MPLTVESLRARRRELIEIAARRGAHNIRVFGSVSRGDATEESDVDLIVDFDPERPAMDLLELMVALEDALGVPRPCSRNDSPSATTSGQGACRRGSSVSEGHDRRYLEWIRDSVQRIFIYRRDNPNALSEDGPIRDAIVWRLETIAEATTHL